MLFTKGVGIASVAVKAGKAIIAVKNAGYSGKLDFLVPKFKELSSEILSDEYDDSPELITAIKKANSAIKKSNNSEEDAEKAKQAIEEALSLIEKQKTELDEKDQQLIEERKKREEIEANLKKIEEERILQAKKKSPEKVKKGRMIGFGIASLICFFIGIYAFIPHQTTDSSGATVTETSPIAGTALLIGGGIFLTLFILFALEKVVVKSLQGHKTVAVSGLTKNRVVVDGDLVYEGKEALVYLELSDGIKFSVSFEGKDVRINS